MSLPRAPPLSPHPVNCAESAQGEEQRGSGHGGHGQGVLPSVAPQLSRVSPHRSFPSSYPERGRGLSCKLTPQLSNLPSSLPPHLSSLTPPAL